MKKDSKEEFKKLKEEREGLKEIFKMMGAISNKPKYKYFSIDTDLNSLTTDIAHTLDNLEDKQIEEITNMLEQFIKLLNDYLKENHIEIERL